MFINFVKQRHNLELCSHMQTSGCPVTVMFSVRVTVMQVTWSSKTLGNIIQLVDRPANDMFMLDGTLDR